MISSRLSQSTRNCLYSDTMIFVSCHMVLYISSYLCRNINLQFYFAFYIPYFIRKLVFLSNPFTLEPNFFLVGTFCFSFPFSLIDQSIEPCHASTTALTFRRISLFNQKRFPFTQHAFAC